MQRIDSRTVELTPAERRANEYFEGSLDLGLSIPLAADLTRVDHPGLSPAFYEWLADDEIGRYSNGACNRGLPLTGYVDGSCSGDCHPITDDRYPYEVKDATPTERG